MVRVMTVNGGVMELRPPVTAECITNGFPGHGVFRAAKSRSPPLLHNEELQPGETYYLRPFNASHISASSSSIVASYRVSFKQKQDLEVPPRYAGGGRGVWKVKLVISPAQLADILSPCFQYIVQYIGHYSSFHSIFRLRYIPCSCKLLCRRRAFAKDGNASLEAFMQPMQRTWSARRSGGL